MKPSQAKNINIRICIFISILIELSKQQIMPKRLVTMDQKQAAKIFKALSNPKRLEIFMEIAKGQEKCFKTGEECFIYEMLPRLNIGTSTISHHLKELSNAGLITTERKGKFLVARINEDFLDEVKKVLDIL